MNLETYAAFVLFVLVMTGTPGVGNISMMAIGQTTGYRSSLPFLAGAVAGMAFLNLMVGLGLGALLLAMPDVAFGLKVAGMVYILYLGWKIMTMHIGEPDPDRRFTVLEGLLLHPTNPKSWTMSVVGFSQLADPSLPLWVQMAYFIPTFIVFQTMCHSLWGVAGVFIMRTLRSRRALLAVNALMVAAMVGSTAYAMLV